MFDARSFLARREVNRMCHLTISTPVRQSLINLATFLAVITAPPQEDCSYFPYGNISGTNFSYWPNCQPGIAIWESEMISLSTELPSMKTDATSRHGRTLNLFEPSNCVKNHELLLAEFLSIADTGPTRFLL